MKNTNLITLHTNNIDNLIIIKKNLNFKNIQKNNFLNNDEYEDYNYLLNILIEEDKIINEILEELNKQSSEYIKQKFNKFIISILLIFLFSIIIIIKTIFFNY
jgi:precorrin-2 methylase